MKTHAFKQKDGLVVTPSAAVVSYSLVDIMAHSMSAKVIVEEAEKLQPEIQKSRPELKMSHILGLCIQIAMKESNFDEMPAEERNRLRPYHYRTSNEQVVHWVKTDTPEDRLLPQPYAVLFSPIDDPNSNDIVLHDSADEAVKQHLMENDGQMETTGHHRYYQSTFGGNEAYMFQHINFSEATTQKRMNAFQSADRLFKQQQRDGVIESIKQRVLSDINVQQHGWATLYTMEGEPIIEVPKLPLMCWALSQAGVAHHFNGYTAVSPRNFKMRNDNPYHTDWMIAAGLTDNEDYKSSSPIQQAAYNWAHDFQTEELDIEHHILSKGNKDIIGTVRHANKDNVADIRPGDIVILPNASPDYQLHIEQACKQGGAIITEVGGKGVHLVTVSNERGFTMLRINNARELYPDGTQLLIQPSQGKVLSLKEEPFHEILNKNTHNQ